MSVGAEWLGTRHRPSADR